MLVDRLKNLIKLKGGEYIALESMEASYSTSPYCAALNGGTLCSASCGYCASPG